MEYVIICIAAFLASGLTLFSGFGLGTLLTPVLALFFPVSLAVGATAIVHLANNIFKAFLLGRGANKEVLWRFGLPAVLASFLGASLLGFSLLLPAIHSYEWMGRVYEITYLKLMIGFVIILFAVIELLPVFHQISFDSRHLPLGGFLSGFFGGLSGHQGALRSLFLIKSSLSKEEFVATNIMLAVMVDTARIAVYGIAFYTVQIKFVDEYLYLILLAMGFAFLGAYIGKKLLPKITIETIQRLVAVMLIVIGTLLAAGLI